jgi:adenine-specific DNA-methyltransferase
VLDEMDAHGEIYWSPNGNPRRKIYLDQSEGVPVQDIWLEFRDAHNQNIRITGYPTEKNPELLARLIEASSNPGDLILDCFSGSGTTLAVASGLGRVWIGIDNSPEAIATTLRRFARGTEPMGDFVCQRLSRQGRDAVARPDSALSLFDPLDLEPTEPPRPDAHAPITDFCLWTNPEQVGNLRECLNEWTRCFPGV